MCVGYAFIHCTLFCYGSGGGGGGGGDTDGGGGGGSVGGGILASFILLEVEKMWV